MGYVYLICDNSTETYKVGMTKKKPEVRLKELKTGNSNELFIVSFYESNHYKIIETLFHRRFKHFCENREWFSLPNDIIFKFKELCQEIEETHLFLKENNSLYK